MFSSELEAIICLGLKCEHLSFNILTFNFNNFGSSFYTLDNYLLLNPFELTVFCSLSHTNNPLSFLAQKIVWVLVFNNVSPIYILNFGILSLFMYIFVLYLFYWLFARKSKNAILEQSILNQVDIRLYIR